MGKRIVYLFLMIFSFSVAMSGAEKIGRGGKEGLQNFGKRDILKDNIISIFPAEAGEGGSKNGISVEMTRCMSTTERRSARAKTCC